MKEKLVNKSIYIYLFTQHYSHNTIYTTLQSYRI